VLSIRDSLFFSRKKGGIGKHLHVHDFDVFKFIGDTNWLHINKSGYSVG
jgi:hypothetical protein